MATNDYELVLEVQNLTEYDDEIIEIPVMLELVELAKREIRAKAGIIDLEFFGTNDLYAERALFWLTCLFAKIKMGELENVHMSIGDIEQRTLRADEDGEDAVVWKQEFQDYMARVQPSENLFGIRSVGRSDRTYSYE
ncbi:hypothetical protein [Halorubellus litoreus]|uniref:Uncharacterized protein n=1 Tax=Halorubellus litoreus TaxID=755308 RepID=A0ABD5VKP9_9EURY